MKPTILLSLLTLLLIPKAFSQPFVESSNILGVEFSADFQGYGAGLSCYDWNFDGLDDLTFATASNPRFYLNNGNGFAEVMLGVSSSQEIRSILWVDYDNDGDADLFLTRFFGPWSLYRNDGNNQFIDATASSGILDIGIYASHGACWGDVNNDGWVDLYICNYSASAGVTNFFYLSNGNGTFTECASSRGIDDGNKLSFQSVFFDANMDGWQDLYIANDKTHANSLYLNNGNGFFTDISESSLADIVIDAMSNSIADYDNDGDLDIYVSNSEENKFLVNNGNLTFTEQSAVHQLAAEQFSWGAVWLDADLDMRQDLFVATGPLSQASTDNLFFVASQLSDDFTLDSNAGFNGNQDLTYCAAAGDFNMDGLPDLALSKRDLDDVDVWINNGAQGNYLKVSLEGVASNRDGLGSVIKCYAGGIQQLRYTYCGEQYMSQNSSYELFGLRNETNVDSLSVTWLSGTRDVVYNIASNQTLSIVEGTSSVTVGLHQDSNQTKPIQISYLNGVPVLFSKLPVDLSLFDQQGKLILTQSITGRSVLDQLSQGIYFAKILGPNKNLSVEKLVVTH